MAEDKKFHAHWIHTASGRFYLGFCSAGFEVLAKEIVDAARISQSTPIDQATLKRWIEPKSVLAQGVTEFS